MISLYIRPHPYCPHIRVYIQSKVRGIWQQQMLTEILPRRDLPCQEQVQEISAKRRQMAFDLQLLIFGFHECLCVDAAQLLLIQAPCRCITVTRCSWKRQHHQILRGQLYKGIVLRGQEDVQDKMAFGRFVLKLGQTPWCYVLGKSSRKMRSIILTLPSVSG